jgi:hypothetical protein
MSRKNEVRVRRQTISSEFRNAFVVKNKCEQLKLEKQHKSLDRLRDHESLDLMNKKREILGLQMSILSSKTGDNPQESCNTREPVLPVTDIGTRKMKFRSRALSTSASSINSFLGGNCHRDNRTGPSSVNCNIGKIHRFKKMSRSVSISGNIDLIMRQKCTALQTDNNNEATETSSCSANGDESSSQAIWKLLPPIQLTPLYKQKSKSLKEISSRCQVASRKSSVPQKNTSRSWNDLQDCRYLRRTCK